MKPIQILSAIVLALVVSGGAYLGLTRGSDSTASQKVLGLTERYHEIADPAGFINTEPLTLGELIGKKVILVDFMTYSCINCQRTFPYVKGWYEKYKDQGLEIVGVHTPEFAFEKDLENVKAAMKKAGITYPVVLDNDYGTWKAWGNQYWPRKYLIDIHGNVVYDHIGEGNYEETERKIQELLQERAQVLNQEVALADVTKDSPALSVGKRGALSPETYFGSGRNEYLGNGTPGVSGERSFTVPKNPEPNKLYLVGTWNIQSEYAAGKTSSRIRYTYTGKDVHLVASASVPTTLTILLDGVPVKGVKGSDVEASTSTVTIKEDRLYNLIQDTVEGRHTIEIQVTSGELKAFAFTFG